MTLRYLQLAQDSRGLMCRPVEKLAINRKQNYSSCLGLESPPCMLSTKQNSHRILAYGHEAVLLETRCMVLRQAGFHVDAASSAKEFEARIAQAKIPYSLFLLGHTIPFAEQKEIAESTANSATAVYQLTEFVPPQDLIDSLAELLRADLT
jgi:hypothetical protein